MFQAPTEAGLHGPRGHHVQRIVASRGRGLVMTQLRATEVTSASASMRTVRSAPRTRVQPQGELSRRIKRREKLKLSLKEFQGPLTPAKAQPAFEAYAFDLINLCRHSFN